MKKLLVRLVLVGECPLTFFVNVFARGLFVSERNQVSRSGPVAQQPRQRDAASHSRPALLSLRPPPPRATADPSHLHRHYGSASFCVHLHPTVAQ